MLLSALRRLPYVRYLSPAAAGPEPVDFVPVGVGLQFERGDRKIYWDNAKRFSATGETFCLCQYTLSGSFGFRWAGGQFRPTAETGFLITIPSETVYWLPEQTEWEFIWISFAGESAARQVSALMQAHGPLFNLPATTEPIRRLLRIYAAAVNGSPPSPFAVSAEIYAFLMGLAQSLGEVQPGLPENLSRAVAEIEARLGDAELTLDQVAAAAGLSKYHFARRFRQEMGCAPGAYLRRRRLEQAEKLLRFTDLPLKQIAAQCGFASAAYFSAAFRQAHGYPPRRERQ